MCHKVAYTLPCEHIRTEIIYCGNAIVDSPPFGGRAAEGGSSRSPDKLGSKPASAYATSSSTKSRSIGHSVTAEGPLQPSAGYLNGREEIMPPSRQVQSAHHKRPCTNMSVQLMPYPTPPSFTADPSSYSSSPLSPLCPLNNCPFEQKNRCWNCCWCGKGWNMTGRCSCVLLVDGNQVRCEHLCCAQCEAAGGETGRGPYEGIGWV